MSLFISPSEIMYDLNYFFFKALNDEGTRIDEIVHHAGLYVYAMSLHDQDLMYCML